MEMFLSSTRSDGRYAGVFEYDDETGYFYLYKPNNASNNKVIAAIHLLTGTPNFFEKDISICWDCTEDKVGIFIQKKLWAVFDCRTGEKYGGNYYVNAQPQIPLIIINSFAQ